MKLPIYERSWHGIDFNTLPVQVAAGRPADANFYTAFYAALKDRPVDPQWLVEKHKLADWIERMLLHRRVRPRLLAIATGLAAVEQQWLAHGYDVTLNDCSAESLETARAQFPEAKLLIGSITDLTIGEEYDVITMFAFDYALDDHELQAVFAKLHGALAEGGIILNLTLNILSLRRLLAEGVKHLLGRYRRPGWVWWGWARSPAALMQSAANAGLRNTAQYIGAGSEYAPRGRFFWRLLPLKKQEILMVFERADA